MIKNKKQKNKKCPMIKQHSNFHKLTKMSNALFYAIFLWTNCDFSEQQCKSLKNEYRLLQQSKLTGRLFLRESGWKCKALQSQLERLCDFHHFDQSAWGCPPSFRNSENIYWPVHCHPRIQNMHNQERTDLSCCSVQVPKEKVSLGPTCAKVRRSGSAACNEDGGDGRSF